MGDRIRAAFVEGAKSCGPYLRRYKSGREWLPTKSENLVGEISKDKTAPSVHPVKVPRSRTRTMTACAAGVGFHMDISFACEGSNSLKMTPLHILLRPGIRFRI